MTTLDPGIPVKLEFWFDLGSNYSYLSMMRIEALAERHDVAISWKPFLLGAIFKSFGWESSPFVLQKEKGAHTWRDMARQCEKYGLPWTQPGHFPRSALIGAEQPWISAFCKRLMQMNFAEDRDINDPAVVDVVLTKLGLPAQEIIVAAQSEDSKRDMRAQTDEALRRGIFGAPTFFAGTDMFWGNDRLEDALLLAAKKAK
jgi:2-hydroxychromene-2-carboxylate isomerase